MPRERREDESWQEYWTRLHAEIDQMITERREELDRLRDKIRDILGDESDPLCGVRSTKPKKR